MNAKVSFCLLGSLAVLFCASPADAAAQKSRKGKTRVVRYVRIELPGNNRTLSLAEIQVVRDGRNIAANGVATQSSTKDGAMAGRAIDGSTSGVFADGSVTMTEAENETWWELDLGKAQGVQQVNVWNRTDSGGERLNSFTLQLFDGRRKMVWERKGLSAPVPRTDYLMSGEAVIIGSVITDDSISDERRKNLQPRINMAIDEGVRFLKDTQLRDGSWSAHVPQYRAGQTALSVYTLLKCGVSRRDASIRMGLRFLEENPPVKTYSTGIALMLYETLADENLLNRMQGLLDQLLDTQIKGDAGNGGLWGYPSGCDLSNTQYAALGLLASHRAGLKVPTDAFEALAAGTIRTQEEPLIVKVEAQPGQTTSGERRMAGYSYRVGENKSSGSMTTAGLSILAICQLGLEGRIPRKRMAEARTSSKLGLEWLHQRFSVKDNPGKGSGHLLYYLYGLERVGALLGRDFIGGKHWYWEGSEVIVGKQSGTGAFGGEPQSCFALLFLSKATSKGPSTGSRPSLTAKGMNRVSEGPGVDIQWRVTGINPVTMWITGFNEQMIDDYSSEEALVSGLRVLKVDYFCAGEIVKSIDVNPGKGWDGRERFAAKVALPGSGTYKMEVRVRVLDPYAAEGDPTEVTLISDALEVYVRDEFTKEAIEATARPRKPNLLDDVKVEYSASSEFHEKNHVLAKALDNLQGTKWLSAKDDETPTLKFAFDRPSRANTLTLSDANASISGSNIYDRPTRIEVMINNNPKTKFVDTSSGVLSNWTLKFKAMRIRSLEIRILDREPGQKQPGVVGFSEVRLTFER